MRIVIVTVYNSMNSGSYLQAYSLYQSLVNIYGNKVYFLKAGTRNPRKDTMDYCTKKLLKLDFKAAAVRKKMYDDLSKYVNQLPEISFEEVDYQKDVFILGSDEIWNIKRSCMSDYPIFWGKGLPYERTFSYAPSVNTSKKSDIEKHDYALEALEKLRFLSVRDTASKEELSKITSRDIELVGDPTNLLEIKQFEERLEKCNDDNYILIYINPLKISEERVKMIQSFAKSRNLKLISFSFQNRWCDKIVNGSPYLFLSYIYHAKYVFTATFHGTTFSILFNKQFVSFDESNRKVYELLSTYGLTERLMKDSDNEGLDAIADATYDKELLNSRIANVRSNSLKYLSDSIKTITEEV